MQNKFDLSVKTITKNNIKYSWAFVLLLIPVTSYADFSFTNYPYTLTNLHANNIVDTDSYYTINFTPVQTGGTINSFEYINDVWTPVSYTYTVAPNTGVVESTNIAITESGQSINGYFHNMTSSWAECPSSIFPCSINTIAGDFIGNNQSDNSQGGALTTGSDPINSIYGDFINNSTTSVVGGGAIRTYFTTIDNIQGNFVNNQSIGNGGGIYNVNGTINNISGAFIHNSASGSGGAIANSSNILNITGQFINNSATEYGGAISTGVNTLENTITNSAFVNNHAKSGGAISSGSSYAPTTITDSIFVGNQALLAGTGGAGGAIKHEVGTINMNAIDEEVVFYNNKATRFGGAVYNSGTMNVNALGDNITFSNNQTDEDFDSGLGGAIYNEYNGILNLNADGGDIIFTQNYTTSHGGGIYNSGTTTFNATNGDIIFSNNIAGTGGAVYSTGTMTFNANGGDVTFSNQSKAIYSTGVLNLNATNGNILFNGNTDYAIKTTGTLNFAGTGISFMTDSDDVILINDGIANINSGASVCMYDVSGNGVVNNFGTLTINGQIGSDLSINNKGNLVLSATQVNNNITTSNNGYLTLTGGTLSISPEYYGNLVIDGDVISNSLITQSTIINSGKSLQINANDVRYIANNGTLYLTGGTLNHNTVTGAGTIVTTSNVSGYAGNFGNNVTNNYNLTLLSAGGNSGILSKNIDGTGNLIIDGYITVNNGVSIEQNITINQYKQLAISASDINTSIVNDGTLSLTGGTLTATNITGDGKVLISGAVASDVNINQPLEIAQNMSLTINADNITNSILNNGTLYLTGGTLEQHITGYATTNIVGDVYTSASNLPAGPDSYLGIQLPTTDFGDVIIGEGHTLTLTGGGLGSKAISGDGTLVVDGNVNAYGVDSFESNIIINQDKTLAVYVDAIQHNITNNGYLSILDSYTNSGEHTIEHNITGGTTEIHRAGNEPSEAIIINNAVLNTDIYIVGSTLVSSADNLGGTVRNNGTLYLTGGTLAHGMTGSGGITYINGNVQSSASNLYGNITVNDSKTLTLTDGTLHSALTGDGAVIIAGNVEIDNSVMYNGNPTDIHNNISINSGAELHIVAGAIKNDIQNDGSLYITSSVGRNTIEHDITGGTTIIDGSANNIAVINNALLDTEITINSNKTLVSSANGIGGTVNNNGYLAISGGTITHNITGTGQTTINGAVTNNALISQTMVVNSGKSLTTAANGIDANILNNGNVTLTGGTVNHNITGGGTVTIDGNIVNNGILGLVAINENKSLTTSADSIYGISSNNGTLYLNGGTLGYSVNGDVYITGAVTNTASQWQSINISNGGTFTTTANLLTNNNAIVNDGTLNITGGNLQQNVTGGNTIIAQNATTSATSFGNLELNGIMNVGTNTVNIANADINGTINLGISALNKNSSAYTGGHILVNDVTFGDNAKLSLTVTDTNLQKGDSSGDVSIITASGTWTGDFNMLTSNNLYDIAYNDNNHTFTFSRKKLGADLITENNGSELDVNVATVWDELQSSNNQNVQSIINAIDYNSQHNAKKYATLIHNLAPHNNQVTVGAIRNVNTAINNRVTARLATVRTSTVTNNDVNRHQPNRYNRNPYYYMGYQGRSGGDVAPVTNNGLWVEGLYNYAQQNDDTKFSGKTFGVTGGFDSKLTEHLTAGLGYAFNKTTIDADNHDIDATGHTGFVYAEYKPTQWYLDALLSYNMTNYQDSSVLVDNLSVNSDYKTNSFGGSVISGYDFQKGYDLYGGLNYIGIKQDAYADTAGQYVKADDTQTLTLTAGGKYRMTSQNMKKASTILKAAVLYDVMSDDGVTTVTVGNNNYIVRGDGIDPFGVQAGIMFDALGNNANLSIGYDLEWRNNFISHTGYIKLKYNF